MTQATPSPDASNPQASHAQPPKKSSLGRKILIGLGVLVGVVVLFILLIPTLLSTNAGKNFILGYVNDAISGKVEVDSISLAWFSGQSITGVKVLDPNGQTVATVAKIDMPSVRPTSFMNMANDLGTITIDKPELSLVKNADGTTNIASAFAPKPGAAGSSSSGSSSSSSGGETKIVGPRGVVQVNGLVVTAKGFAPETATVNVSTLTVDAKDLGKLGLAMKGDAAYGADKGLIGADLTVQGLISPAGDIEAGKAKIVGTIEARKLPVAVADAMANQNGLLVLVLGKELNVEVKADMSQQAGDGSVKVDSENLTVEIAVAKQGDAITLGKGNNGVKLAIKRDAVNELFKRQQAPATLKKDINVGLTIKSLSVPMANGAVDTNKLKLQAEMTADDVILDVSANNIGLFEWKGTRLNVEIPEALEKEAKLTLTGGSPTTGGVNVAASARNLTGAKVIGLDAKVDNIPLNVVDTLTKQEGKLVALLGEKLELVRVQAALNSDQHGSVSLSIKSANLNGGVYANLKPEGVALDSSQKSAIGLVMSPAAFGKFMGPDPAMVLKQPLTVDLKINGFSLPKQGEAYAVEKAAADVELVLGDVAAEIPGKPAINWAKTTAAVKTAALGEAVTVKVQGGSAATGKLDMTTDVTKPMDALRTVKANGELTQFPVALADAFSGQEGKLVALIGAQIKVLKFGAEVVPNKPIRGTVEMTAEQMEAKLGVTVDTAAGLATIDSGNYAKLTLTPAAAQKLMPPAPAPAPAPGAAPTTPQNFKLVQPVELRVDLNKVQVGWTQAPAKVAQAKSAAAKTASDAAAPAAPGAMALDPSRTAFNIGLKHDKGTLLMTRTGETMRLGAGEYTVKSDNPSKEISVTGKSALQGIKSGAAMGPGEFKIDKMVAKGLKFEGFAPVTRNFDVDARLGGKNIPVEAVDTYMGKNGQYSSILGTDLDFGAGLGTQSTTFHLDGTTVPEMTGPLDAQLSTRTNGKPVATADLAGNVKGGRFTATKDNVVTIMMSPEVSKQFLQKIAPVIEAVSNEDGKPSKVALKNNYSMIASPFDIKSLDGTIEVDLGTLKLMKGGALTTLFSTMAKFYAPAQKMVDSDYAAVFKPVDVLTKGGKASYTGMDMNAGPIQMSFDGNVDYVNNVIDGMVIHVKGETFKDVKALSNTIKPGETVKIRVSGPVSKPKMDFGDLIAFGAKAAAGNLLKGETGEKVNSLLDGVLGGKKTEEPKKDETKKEEPKKDDVGSLINEGINLFGKKKEQPPATQPKK